MKSWGATKKRQVVGRPCAYLYPGTLASADLNSVQVIAPDGLAESQVTSAKDFSRLLVAAGAIKTCSAATRRKLAVLYGRDETSRTTAFFDAVLDHPEEVVRVMDRLAAMRAVVVGCGGIGVGAAFLLAGMGVKNFVLIDSDHVDKSNLNRQFLYTLRDVGAAKVDVLSRELRRRFTNLFVEKIHGTLNPEDLTLKRNAVGEVVIVSADNPPNLFAKISHNLPSSSELWSAGYLHGISRVARITRKQAIQRQYERWLYASSISPSIGFQNFEVCARLAFCIAIGSTSTSYFFDYRDAR